MKNLREQVAQTIRARNLFRDGERILVAVSGGVDSMVLLAVLHEWAIQSGRELCVVHFNHQLRGRASDADERFVRNAAAKLGWPYHAGRGNVKTVAKEQGISIEMAARDLRHQFLAQAASILKYRVIATAHHADDQVELFFLRLLRGAGGEGLAGMKWDGVSPAGRRVRIVRPLLDVTKAELLDFARENGILFREDASNASRDVLRNRIRHELLPLLRRDYQPSLHRTVPRLMDLIGADADAVGLAAEAWLKRGRRRAAWADLPAAVQRRVVQLQLQRLKLAVEFDLVEALRNEAGKIVCVAQRSFVVRDEVGRICQVKPAAHEFQKRQARLNLKTKAAVTFAGVGLEWGFISGFRTKLRNQPGCEHFDAEKVGDKVVLRHWQPGDRFQPIGMSAAVKLQDWFTNLKIPAGRRRELVLATTARGEIFWVQGLRIGEAFKLTANTRQVLAWCWRVR